LFLERRLDVGHGNLLAGLHRLDPADAGGVDQDAAGDDRMELLDPVLLQAVGIGHHLGLG
jgi:hypothetical protein